ncbi:site-specific integrase [Bacillus velezensis]|uniref:site-specific integrase n=1 Tax=Bacillus velezensis TaxID=492670 RepID=UPI00227EBF70|nr:site-specific integrase [Bacillus velezensis]MCY7683256.1 site-specific integrase [Bacillus velezensis]MDH3119579.1 site-specific integrase [Bacillus subtilis]WEZ01587.1 site-specific integrase [Bacillus subtilis]WGE06141.1 site-specific integrase [Bacillus subtilis]
MDEKNVQPLRTIDEINDMKWALRRFGTERDRFLFVFGINTGLRVSDIVPLKVGDVRGKQHVITREKKTGKVKRFYLNKALQDEINEYTYGMDDTEYLFPSRKGSAHISTTQAYRVLTKAAVMLGRDDVGTHTMRKTFGYHHYKRNKDVATLQTLFNHSAPSITLKYIGITDDEVQATLEDFSL